jgi:hypothetical protein
VRRLSDAVQMMAAAKSLAAPSSNRKIATVDIAIELKMQQKNAGSHFSIQTI